MSDTRGVRRRVPPVVTRSRAILEMACQLVAEGNWPRQARVMLRHQGGQNPWQICLFGGDAPASIVEVARGEVQIGIVNPAAPLALAFRGKGPFKEPLPVRTISVIPSADFFLFAVAGSTGLGSLQEIRDRRYPLRVSMRAQPDHSTYLVVNEVLGALGFSLDDILAWGGTLAHHSYPPDVENVRRGEIDAIFDEAAYSWGNAALEAEMRVLPLPEPLLRQMEEMGFRRGLMTRAEFPALTADLPTLDFSGWPIYTYEGAPEGLVRACCAALEERRDSIPWQEEGPLPIERMCIDARDTPIAAPLHPAAEEYWRRRGYL